MLEALSSSTIPWMSDLDGAFEKAKSEDRLVLIQFSQAPRCAGSVALASRVYTHQHVADFLISNFVPVSMLRSERPVETTRFNVIWTPTIIIAEADGTECHRIVGFLPETEFMAQLELGVSKVTFGREQFVDAQRAFASVVERYPQTFAGPEAAYWSGVSEYKQDKNRAFLKSTGLRLREQYPNSDWAAKSAVWLD